MRIGVVFPQTEIGNDPVAIRDYAQTVEGLGFRHLLAYDHVLGANPDRAGGWRGPYTHETPFHEPFVLFSYLAAVTRTLEFVTGIIILPQRQTALVAKQAASLDVLSGGRLRLGVGIGWNEVEYVALGENFRTRGRRIEEQVTLLRELWTKPLVTFNGEWDIIPDAGVNPLPAQQPIPIWFGGHAEAVLRRVARTGDGWLPNHRSIEDARPHFETLWQFMDEEGRARSTLGIEARIPYGEGRADEWAREMKDWETLGATHISINTMGHGFATPGDHLAALRIFADNSPLSHQG